MAKKHSNIEEKFAAKTRGFIRGVFAEWKLLAVIGAAFASSIGISTHSAHTDAKATVWKEAGDNLGRKTTDIHLLQLRIAEMEHRLGVRQTNYNVNTSR